MQKFLHVKFLLLVTLFLTACHRDDCYMAVGINGTWQWTKSIGGFAGSTHTPATENETRLLVIDDFLFQEYHNGSLYFESPYELEIRQDSAFGTNKFIVFEKGGENAVVQEGNHLELHELCPDCFDNYYKRN